MQPNFGRNNRNNNYSTFNYQPSYNQNSYQTSNSAYGGFYQSKWITSRNPFKFSKEHEEAVQKVKESLLKKTSTESLYDYKNFNYNQLQLEDFRFLQNQIDQNTLAIEQGIPNELNNCYL